GWRMARVDHRRARSAVPREARVGFYTDWFLAGEGEAEAIASTVSTEERSFEDWPNLSIENVGESDLSALWGILRGAPTSLDSASGDLLFQDSGGVFISRVVPGFVEALAGIKSAALK